ncbi:NAD/NADP octopine/nopaline dehydrogenase family protein [Virgibacillus byunsanensis]|uniref:NAD/NADP octopine/nopaline dehydrogenase family protein n=1 Tax=Virgibacillus byunsanensis TaxID=570945 RepID=A0ABW3LID7_9BACI
MLNNLNNGSKICVIGAGNGGLAAAADLTIRGNKVTLFELPEFEHTLTDIKKIGGLYLETMESSNLLGGYANLYKITNKIEDALEESEIVLIIVPAFAHRRIAEVCAKHLKREHIVVLAPSNMGGSIEFYNSIIENGGEKDVIISEFECMMYACRKIKSDTVYIRGYKYNLGFSTFPSSQTDKVFNKVKNIYPEIIKRNNVLETGMSNCNPILHVPILLFNLSLIDNKINTLMYHEAFTNSIGNIITRLDEERCSLNNTTKDINLVSLKNVIKCWYSHQGARGTSFVEIVGKNPIYYASKLPSSLNHRYITEDVPFGLIPMLSFLKKFEGKSRNIQSLVDLVCVTTGNDYYQNARTIGTLKLEGMSKKEIISYVKNRA